MNWLSRFFLTVLLTVLCSSSVSAEGLKVGAVFVHSPCGPYTHRDIGFSVLYFICRLNHSDLAGSATIHRVAKYNVRQSTRLQPLTRCRRCERAYVLSYFKCPTTNQMRHPDNAFPPLVSGAADMSSGKLWDCIPKTRYADNLWYSMLSMLPGLPLRALKMDGGTDTDVVLHSVKCSHL
jgi:hypothetical protein